MKATNGGAMASSRLPSIVNRPETSRYQRTLSPSLSANQRPPFEGLIPAQSASSPYQVGVNDTGLPSAPIPIVSGPFGACVLYGVAGQSAIGSDEPASTDRCTKPDADVIKTRSTRATRTTRRE